MQDQNDGPEHRILQQTSDRRRSRINLRSNVPERAYAARTANFVPRHDDRDCSAPPRRNACHNRRVHIRLEHVIHEYAASDESGAVRVLDDISLDIARGDFAVLVGASGSGKSTLLNLLGAVDRPTGGRLLLDDVDTASLDEKALTQIRRTGIGFIFQFFHLIPTLTVFENVAFPLSLARTGRAETTERTNEVLRQVGLSHRATHFPNQLSGGEMQRVAIGRAIIHRPRLMLADEPTGNLDSRNGQMILELIQSIHAQTRQTIVMATHSAQAAAHGDYTIEIADGRLARTASGLRE
jgi:putative ABC transport system ATP-binding protein